MPNDLQCLFARDIATFMERLTAENYKPQTIKAYRVLLTRLVSLIEAAEISPQDLTAERAAELVRNDERNRREPNKCQNIARRFVAHLITSGTVPAPVATPGQMARAALRVDYEESLVRQRGISPRTIYHPPAQLLPISVPARRHGNQPCAVRADRRPALGCEAAALPVA